MTHLIAIPKLGLTMTDCTLVEWLKNDGDRVERGDILFAIETDKITSEIEADGAGFLRRFADISRPSTPEGSWPGFPGSRVSTPIQPITGWPSLAPSSFTRSPMNSPCGSLSLAGELRVYHVPLT